MKLYLVHDEYDNYKVIVYATNGEDAIEKMHKWMVETKQNGEFFNSKNVKWIADLCDNNKVLE